MAPVSTTIPPAGNDQQSNRWRYHPTGRISSRAGPRLAPSQRSSATPLRPINPCAVADPTCSKTLMQLSSPRVPPAHPPAALTCHLLLSISLGKLHQEVQLAYLSCQVGHVQMPPIGVQPAPRSAPSCPGSPDVVVCAVRFAALARRFGHLHAAHSLARGLGTSAEMISQSPLPRRAPAIDLPRLTRGNLLAHRPSEPLPPTSSARRTTDIPDPRPLARPNAASPSCPGDVQSVAAGLQCEPAGSQVRLYWHGASGAGAAQATGERGRGPPGG